MPFHDEGLRRVEVKITSPDCFPGVASKLIREFDPTGAEPDGRVGPLLDVPFFLQGMMNRMGVSYHKYGSFYDIFPDVKTGVDNALQRLDMYRDTGNLEWLMDAANYIMMEFQCPSHPDAHFRSTGSDESPGSVMTDGRTDHGTDGHGGRRIVEGDYGMTDAHEDYGMTQP